MLVENQHTKTVTGKLCHTLDVYVGICVVVQTWFKLLEQVQLLMVLTCNTSRSGYIVNTRINIDGLYAGENVYLFRCLKQATF